MAARMADAAAALDLQTGGGEVLAGIAQPPTRLVATDFTVDGYRERLAELHDRIQAEGPFVAHSQRFLIEARKPDRA